MTPLERELLRLYVETEWSDDHRAAFEELLSQDRVVLDMLWSLCLVEPEGGDITP